MTLPGCLILSLLHYSETLDSVLAALHRERACRAEWRAAVELDGEASLPARAAHDDLVEAREELTVALAAARAAALCLSALRTHSPATRAAA